MSFIIKYRKIDEVELAICDCVHEHNRYPGKREDYVTDTDESKSICQSTASVVSSCWR